MEVTFIMDNNKENQAVEAERNVLVKVPKEIWVWMHDIHSDFGVNKSEQLKGLLERSIHCKDDLMKGIIGDVVLEAKRKLDELLKVEANINNEPVLKPKEKAKRKWVATVPVMEEEKPVEVRNEEADKLVANSLSLGNLINKAVKGNPSLETSIKSELIKAVGNNKGTSEEVYVDLSNKDQVREWDWNTYSYKKYIDLDIMGNSMRGHEVLNESNLTAGFMNGYYKWLHSQSLALWKAEETDFTIKDLCKLQPIVDKVTGESRKPSVQTMAKRLMKAIVHFGTKEEKALLFQDNPSITPRYTSRKTGYKKA